MKSYKLKEELIKNIKDFEFGEIIDLKDIPRFNKMLSDTIYDILYYPKVQNKEEVEIDPPCVIVSNKMETKDPTFVEIFAKTTEELITPISNPTPFDNIIEATIIEEPKKLEISEVKPNIDIEPLFPPDLPISYNSGEMFCYFGVLQEVVLFADDTLASEIVWKNELKVIGHVYDCEIDDLPAETILNILKTEFNKYHTDSKDGPPMPVVTITILKELEKGIPRTKFYDYLYFAYKAYMKETQPKNMVVLSEHQQEKFDGLMGKIEEIMNTPKGSHINAVQQAPAKYMAVFEGAAGTGKTTTMAKVLDTLVESGYTICFCSPTHQALAVIRETLIENELDFTESPDEFIEGRTNIIIRTLASFLGIKMKRDMETGTETFTTDKRAITFKTDILCIDESSMVSKDQIALLLKRLRIDFEMILWVGDEPQLPSPSDKDGTNGVFNLPFKYSLTQVVRQAEGSQLLNIAHYIRNLILTFQTLYKPSQLLNEQLHNNHDIFITRDQGTFLQHYFNDTEESKIISTYTNKITNEYNTYIRSMAISNQAPSIKLDIVTNGDSYRNTEDKINYITDWKDYKEFYPGEKLIVLETNQVGGSVIHQNGEIITIESCTRITYTIHIETPSSNMMEAPTLQEYTIDYWKIVDTKFKTINIIVQEHKDLYVQLLMLLKNETERRSGKHKWKKYWDFKERFSSVNYLFAATLYKLQGSTYGHLYADLRDLDKFHKWNPVIVYKLLYVALTRPKQRIYILI